MGGAVTGALEAAFWLGLAGVVYAYIGYPLLLLLLSQLTRPRTIPAFRADAAPTLSMIVPVHNEIANIEQKLNNCRELTYPEGRLRVLFVSDGSTDGTAEAVRAAADDRIGAVDLPVRSGKAAALNRGLEFATGDIVVFSDASILLDRDALIEIVRPFALSDIGCVTGEDRIAGQETEGLYGRYELFLRRRESLLYSVVGASGSFYAQRRSLCDPFVPNLAPDFLSVLQTVRKGYRAVAHAGAGGVMAAVPSPGQEFERKVRTTLRGITTLAGCAALLNPFRYGIFAFELLSHKLARWLVPFFLCLMLVASAVLAAYSSFHLMALVAQLAFYATAIVGLTRVRPFASSLAARLALYLAVANVAALWAWFKYLSGVRQEVWSPSRR